MQSKPTRLPVPNNSNQVIPAATNQSAVQEASAAVSNEEVPISLDGTRNQELSKPAQEKLFTEIGALNKKIASYSEFIFKQGEEVRPEQKKQVKNLREEKEKKEKLLKRKIIEAKISQNSEKRKQKFWQTSRKIILILHQNSRGSSQAKTSLVVLQQKELSYIYTNAYLKSLHQMRVQMEEDKQGYASQ